MKRWQLGIAAAGSVVALAALWWLPTALESPTRLPAAAAVTASPAPETGGIVSAEPVPTDRQPATPERPVSGDDAPQAAAESAHAHSSDESPDPFGDLAFYADYPMSNVPHSVVRAWGAGPRSKSPGQVGAFVIVKPDISDEALTQLAEDIQRFHRGAEAVAVRILDDESAATYDRHSDGGEFLEQHLVGRVQRSNQLGLETIEIRGETLVGF